MVSDAYSIIFLSHGYGKQKRIPEAVIGVKVLHFRQYCWSIPDVSPFEKVQQQQ